MMQIGYLMWMSCMPRVDMFCTLGGDAVSRRSCKQIILTRSTMEAELSTLDAVTMEAD
jgi:hypothetical protein